MSGHGSIGAVVHELLGVGVESASSLTGGSIHDVRRLVLADGGSCVVKIADARDDALLRSEEEGLAALAGTGAVRTPAVLGLACHADVSVLVLEHLESGASHAADWETFGRQLSTLHASPAGDRYGFASDNHIGRTPQPNRWCDDWVEFLAQCRLGPQLGLAREHDRLDASLADSIESVIHRLDRLVPRRPRPSLLHGDLWSGNAMPLADGAVAVIDPACFVGDAWFDVGMMRLFGGFPESCFAAWLEGQSDDEQAAERTDVAQLYHLLNHVNLFGAGYVDQVRTIVERLA